MANNSDNIKIVQFGRAEIEIDCRSTEAYYPFESCNMWCQCEGCTNFRLVRDEHFPPGAFATLKRMCINPYEPYYRTSNRRGSIPSGYVRNTGIYILIGHICGVIQPHRLQTDKGNWLWIIPSPENIPLQYPHHERSRGAKTEPQLLVKYSILLPSMFREEDEEQ